MAQFGKVHVKDDNHWDEWSWEDFLSFYKSSLKGHCTETHEQVAKALGVVIPEKVKPDKVKPAAEA